MRTSKGMLIAGAAAGLILAGAVARAEPQEKKAGDMVHCAGINSCKGKGSCAGAGNSCAGQNSCKGKGVTDTSADDCAKKGGKVVAGEKGM